MNVDLKYSTYEAGQIESRVKKLFKFLGGTYHMLARIHIVLSFFFWMTSLFLVLHPIVTVAGTLFIVSQWQRFLYLVMMNYENVRASPKMAMFMCCLKGVFQNLTLSSYQNLKLCVYFFFCQFLNFFIIMKNDE